MVGIKLYVEGGGLGKSLRTACRQGFSELLTKAGLAAHMPRIVASGSRSEAYGDFCTALRNGERAMLLVDSEDPVLGQPPYQPWRHLWNRPGDHWRKPPGATDAHCHLMVQCMEAWFLVDRQTLQAFFGQGFRDNALPAGGRNIETITKHDVYQSLANATGECKTKAPYGKGEHSFKILALIDPGMVTQASGWANRFIAEIKQQMGC